MKWGWIVTFSMYTESLRLARKLLDRSLRPAAIAGYRPLMKTKVHVLLKQLLSSPEQLEAHLHQFVIFPMVSPAHLNTVRNVQLVRIADFGYGVWLRSQGAR